MSDIARSLPLPSGVATPEVVLGACVLVKGAGPSRCAIGPFGVASGEAVVSSVSVADGCGSSSSRATSAAGCTLKGGGDLVRLEEWRPISYGFLGLGIFFMEINLEMVSNGALFASEQ